MGGHSVSLVDPFELPDWLGEDRVTWTAASSLDEAHLVCGSLQGSLDSEVQECDLLACDLAYPGPVLGEKWRAQAHHAWQLGEVLLVDYDRRLTLVTPGTTVTSESALEAVRRLARAVGAPADRFTVALRL